MAKSSSFMLSNCFCILNDLEQARIEDSELKDYDDDDDDNKLSLGK